jgi:RecA/RadA recombinase
MTTLDEFQTSKISSLKLLPPQLNDVFKSILVPNQVSLIHGTQRSPMTVLCHAIAVSCIRTKKSAVYIDSGTNFKPRLAKRLFNNNDVSELENLLVVNVMGLDDIEEIIASLSTDFSIVIIDSLVGAMNLQLPPATKKRQRRLYQLMEKLRTFVIENNSHIVATNHSSREPVTGESHPIGGNVVAHSVDSMIRVSSFENHGDIFQIKIERSPTYQKPESILVRMGDFGIRPIRRS